MLAVKKIENLIVKQFTAAMSPWRQSIVKWWKIHARTTPLYAIDFFNESQRIACDLLGNLLLFVPILILTRGKP